jgi:hypothetical protein
VQIHLISREHRSFPELAELLKQAEAQPPSHPFQVLDLPGELAVVTGGLPSGAGFEEWIRKAVSEPADESGGDGYTEFFQAPQGTPETQAAPGSVGHPTPSRPDPSPSPTQPPDVPPPTVAAEIPPERQVQDPPVSSTAAGDYSEFFQAPGAPPTTPAPPGPPPAPKEVNAQPPEEEPTKDETGGYTEFFRAAGPGDSPTAPGLPPEPPLREKAQPSGPPPPPPQRPPPSQPPPSDPVEPPPTVRPVRPPAQEPDADSITAEFRKPMPPPPQQRGGHPERSWSPAGKSAKLPRMAMGDYLARLDSSSGLPPMSPPPTPATPPAPDWSMDAGGPGTPFGDGGSSAPTVVSRAPEPSPDGGGPVKRFRTRDLVIFGIVVGLVVTAAIVTVVMVLITAD